jgi:hypothetical protein
MMTQKEKDDEVIERLKVGDAISFVETSYIGEMRIGFVVKITRKTVYVSDSYGKNSPWFIRFGRRMTICQKRFISYVRIIPPDSYCAK